MIDLHSHILPGVDDGAASMEASIEIARSAVADGITLVAATPHVRGDYPTSPETMERLLGDLRAALSRDTVALDLRSGGELAFDVVPELADDHLRRFGLGGNPAYLLLEFPYYGWPLGIHDLVFGLAARGFTTVLAHPERNAEVQASPTRLAPLVASGALVQLTAASLDGRLGRAPRAAGRRLIEHGLAHLVASDAHAPTVRQIGMSAAAEAVGNEVLARWLTEDVPGAIVAGQKIPARPRSARRRRLLPWSGRGGHD